MSKERQTRPVDIGWTMERGTEQVPAKMVKVVRVPMVVPNLYAEGKYAAGGRLARNEFKPVEVEDDSGFDDVWGDAR